LLPRSWQIRTQTYFSAFNFGKSKLHKSQFQVISKH